MKISLVTICFNSESSIEDTIKSVLSQDYIDLEYIIVDGGSTDGTLEIVNKYTDQIGKVISEPDEGLYDAINKGIRNATGEVVGLIHSDDFFASTTVISDIAKAFEADVDGVYGDLEYVAQDDTNKVIRNWTSGAYTEGKFLSGWMPPHPTFYVKTALYGALGFYNTSFRISADYELMLRFIHKHKIKLAYLPQVLVKMRVGGESNASLSNRLQANKEDRKAWKINNIKPGMFTTIIKPLSKLKQFFG